MTSRTLPELDWALLDRVRDAVREIEPGARVILYGSRARGDADPESDWDLLVLLDGPVDRRRKEAVRRRLLNLMLETNTALSAVVHSKDEWSSPRYRAMPLHANIMRDGISLNDPPQPLANLNADNSPPDEEDRLMSEAREEIIRHHLDQAREAMAAAESTALSGQWNSCVNRLYYACFHAVTALLLRHGLSAARHSVVQSLFNQHFGRTGLIAADLRNLYNTLFEKRLDADYGEFIWFREAEVRPWLDRAKHFVARIEELLSAPPAEGSDG